MDCFDPFVFSIGNFIDGQKVDVSQSDPGYLPEKKEINIIGKKIFILQ